MSTPSPDPRRLPVPSVLTPVAFLLVVLAAGWPSPASAAPPAAEAQAGPSGSDKRHPAQVLLDQAKTLLDTHENTAAIDVLKRVIASYPGTDYLDDAYLLMGAALIGKKQYDEAIAYLDRLLTEFPDSDLAGRARLALGHAYAQKGEMDQALSMLAEARSLAPEPETQRDALKAMGEILAKRGDVLRAMQSWLDELLLTPEEHQGEVRERVRGLVLAQTDRKLLTRVRDAYPTSFPGDVALIRLAELYTARGEDDLSQQTLRLFLNRFPTHEYAATATDTLQSFSSRLKSSRHLIAAVLPRSGRLAQYGTEALYGIRLAIDQARDSLGLTTVELLVRDSERDRGQLGTELGPLLREYRPLAVIGPMLSRSLPAVAPVAEETQIPFITPSAMMPEVRRYGSYLFSTALTYQQQAHRVAEYAMNKLLYRRFCILYPETSYGEQLSRWFASEVRARGGEIVALESYKDKDTDFGPPIKRLKAEDLKHYGLQTETKLEKGQIKLQYTPGFDAIYVPGDAAQVALVAPQLVFYDIKVPMLGANGWNSPELLRLADRTLDGGIFVDAFFRESPNPVVQDFVERYRRKYQTPPSLFAAQAYDAARLVIEAIRRGAATGREVRDQLAQLHDLPSLGGPTGFGPGGTLDRHVFLIQLKNGRFVQVD